MWGLSAPDRPNPIAPGADQVLLGQGMRRGYPEGQEGIGDSSGWPVVLRPPQPLKGGPSLWAPTHALLLTNRVHFQGNLAKGLPVDMILCTQQRNPNSRTTANKFPVLCSENYLASLFAQGFCLHFWINPTPLTVKPGLPIDIALIIPQLNLQSPTNRLIKYLLITGSLNSGQSL